MKKILSIGLIFIITSSVFADSAFNANLKYGMRGADVVEMQEFLIDQGYLTGTATGNFYSVTLRAVKAFQKANGLSTSGFWGPLSRQRASELIDLEASKKEEVENPIQQATSTQKYTPIIQPVQIITVPVQSTQQVQPQTTTPTPEVKNYTLTVNDLRFESNGYTIFYPSATLNGNLIKVSKCWPTSLGEESVFGPIGIVQNEDVSNRLRVVLEGSPALNAIKQGTNAITCRLEDGKVLTN